MRYNIEMNTVISMRCASNQIFGTDRFMNSNPANSTVLGELEDKVATMEEELRNLKRELDVVKNALRNEIVRFEITEVKKGRDVRSIVD